MPKSTLSNGRWIFNWFQRSPAEARAPEQPGDRLGVPAVNGIPDPEQVEVLGLVINS